MKGHAYHTGLGLAVETSVFALLMGAWLWGILTFGAHATAAQGRTSDDDGYSGRALVSCPAPHEPEREGSGPAVTGDACRPGPRLDAGTSRQPGRDLPSGRVRDTVDRIPEKPPSGRSFERAASARSGG
jgi:hypothetical protein